MPEAFEPPPPDEVRKSAQSVRDLMVELDSIPGWRILLRAAAARSGYQLATAVDYLTLLLGEAKILMEFARCVLETGQSAVRDLALQTFYAPQEGTPVAMLVDEAQAYLVASESGEGVFVARDALMMILENARDQFRNVQRSMESATADDSHRGPGPFIHAAYKIAHRERRRLDKFLPPDRRENLPGGDDERGGDGGGG